MFESIISLFYKSPYLYKIYVTFTKNKIQPPLPMNTIHLHSIYLILTSVRENFLSDPLYISIS